MKCTQVVWIKQLLEGIQEKVEDSVVWFPHSMNNLYQVSLFVRASAGKDVRLEYVPTKEQLANIFTKPLKKDTFEYLRVRLGVICLSCLK